MQAREPNGTVIGMNNIKARRLQLPVSSHLGTYVGQYTPFYFCPRSIMLFILHCANHQDLTYRGGQRPIVHLEADLYDTINWANENGVKWAFTLSNAGSFYFEDRKDIGQLGDVNWQAVGSNDWRAPQVKEDKQAEFLLYHAFPWQLVSSIGVYSQQYYGQVRQACTDSAHRPIVRIQRTWYY